MNNLVFPKERIMFNSSLTIADVGLFLDSKKSKVMLSFKKLGLNIPGVTGTSVPTATSVAQVNTVTLAGSTTEGHSVAIVVNGAGTTAAIPAAANNNVTKAANAYMTAYEATLLALGVVLTNPSAGVLVFTAVTAGTAFTLSAATLTGTLTATNVATTANFTATSTLASNIVSVKKTQTTLGAVSGGVIYLKNTAPCSDCDYSYYLNFKKEVQFPGRDNFETNEGVRHYGGVIARPSITSGLIDAATLIAMEDDLIAQITADRGSLSELTDRNDQAFVEARRCYIVTDADPSDASVFTATWADGTTTVVTSAAIGGAWDVGNLGQATNATTTLKAYRLTENTYMVTSVVAGAKFTIAASGTDTTTASRGIYYKAIDKKVQVTPAFEDSFASMSLFSAAVITGTFTSLTTIVSGIYNGTSFSRTTTNATSAAVTAKAINTGNSPAIPYFALAYSTTSVTIAALGVNSFKVKGNTLTTVTWTVNGKGYWDYLTGDDVFRMFSAQPNTNFKQGYERIDQPSAASTWFKYLITYKVSDQPQAGLAGQTGEAEYNVEIYVNQALYPHTSGNYLYATSDAVSYPKNWSYGYQAGTGANITFEQLLGIWSGLPVTSW